MTALTYGSTQVRPRALRPLLLVFAIGQVVSPIFSALFGGAFTTADRPGEPPIVPAGYAFSIWGVVEALSVAWALWSLSDRRPDLELRDRLAAPLLVVFVGFSVWIVAAELEPTWLTLVVFLVMLAGLLRALGLALQARAAIARWSRLGQFLLWGLLGIYTGWSSIAIWLNLTTALAGSGAPIVGPVAVVAQTAILAGATATAVAILRWTGGMLPYALAVAWAFVGAIIGASGAGQPLLAAAAALGLLVVAVALVVTRRQQARRQTYHR
ncbi:MAG: hypothetical protein ACLGIF_11535 [Actinomycetes bacterium]